MRPIVRRQLAAVTPIAIAAVCLSGCGSGSTGQISVSALTASSKSQATGRAVFKVTWPVRLVANGRLIPVLSNSIRVDVKNSTGTVASQLLVCPYPVAPGGQVGVLTFASLPVGNYTVVATALPNADGSGTAQATGNVQTTVTADATTTFSLTMQSTIDHIALAAANPATTLPATITVGDTLALVALAVDASGSTVLTNLTWTATAPDTGAPSTVATVDSNGLVTSLLTGSVTITATDPESGKFASTLVTVGAVPPRS